MCVVCVLYRVCLGLSVFPGIGILKIATANAVSFPKKKRMCLLTRNLLSLQWVLEGITGYQRATTELKFGRNLIKTIMLHFLCQKRILSYYFAVLTPSSVFSLFLSF